MNCLTQIRPFLSGLTFSEGIIGPEWLSFMLHRKVFPLFSQTFVSANVTPAELKRASVFPHNSRDFCKLFAKKTSHDVYHLGTGPQKYFCSLLVFASFFWPREQKNCECENWNSSWRPRISRGSAKSVCKFFIWRVHFCANFFFHFLTPLFCF